MVRWLVVGHVDGSVDSMKEDKIAFNPFTQ